MEKFQDDLSIKELIQILLEWFNYLKLKWKIIFLAGLFGGLFGFGIFLYNKPIYTATLTFALEEKTSGTGSGLSSIASSFGLNVGGGEGGAFSGDNIIELMKSRLLIEKTLTSKVNFNGKNDLLINRYIDFYHLRKKWSKNKELANLKFDTISRQFYTRTQDSILGSIYTDISKFNLEVTKADKKLNIITVNVRMEDELFAKLFCENLVKNVTDFYVETKIGRSKKNVQILESRVDSVKDELDNAMYGRATFLDQNIGLIRQSAAVPKIKQEMRVQMLSTMYGELVKNLEFSKLALMREEPLIQIIDKPIYPLTKKKDNIYFSITMYILLFSFFTTVILVIKKLIHNYNI